MSDSESEAPGGQLSASGQGDDAREASAVVVGEQSRAAKQARVRALSSVLEPPSESKPKRVRTIGEHKTESKKSAAAYLHAVLTLDRKWNTPYVAAIKTYCKVGVLSCHD